MFLLHNHDLTKENPFNLIESKVMLGQPMKKFKLRTYYVLNYVLYLCSTVRTAIAQDE